MEIPRVNYIKKYRILSRIWDSSLIGKGTMSRTLSKILIPKPTGQMISKTIYDFDLLINPAIDNGVENSLYYFGTYEKGTLRFISDNLSEGNVFFDIGANIGLMSIFASRCAGKQGKVYSFEANPETADLLKYNVNLNKIENITIVEKAVGNDHGKIRIYNNWAINRGGATLIKPETETKSAEVDLIRIDDEKDYQSIKVDMVKVDVEGFELDVLKGMEAILRKQAPKLIIECSADRNNNYDSVYEIYEFIKKVNPAYKIFKLDKGKERFGKLVEVKSKEELPKHDNIFCINY